MDPPPGSVIGLSSLRPKDEPQKPKETEEAKRKKASLNAYLAAAYGSVEGTGDKKKKKKGKGKQKSKKAGGIAIIDADIDTNVQDVRDAGGKKRQESEEDEDAPVIVNEGELRRLQLQEERQKELAERAGAWKVVDAGVIGDASPPRRARHDTDEDDDPSPPRRARHDTDEDGDEDGDMSPPRRARHDSDEDDSDIDVPRRKPAAAGSGRIDVVNDGNTSPGAQGAESDEDSDMDVPRRRPQRMADGSLAGMVTGQELMKEMAEKRARDAQKFQNLDDSVTGRNAKTVYRTEDGRAVSKEDFEQGLRDKRESDKGYVEAAELPWGKGLRQTRGAVDDSGKNDSKQLAVPSRWDDPMGHILAKKNRSGKSARGTSLLDMHAKELRKAGFNVPLEIPPHSWMNRSIQPPPNRFNIAPGRHWDGVERGTQFEAWRMKTLAKQQARRTLGHFLNQEDM